MKAWYVKSEGITHEKQQELLDRAVDAGAVLDEHLSCTRHKGKGKYLQTGDHLFFGVTKDKMTAFEYQTFHFGPDAVEMTYEEAWMYVTGIIRAKRADDSPVPPMPQSKVLPVTQVAPESASMLTKLREVLGEPDMDFDDLLSKVDDNMDVANAARHFMKHTYHVTGDDFDFDEMQKRFQLLVEMVDIRVKKSPVSAPVPPMPQVAPELPEPASTLAKLREVHGNLNASVDEIVENYRQLKEIGHKVYELNQCCQKNNIGKWGDCVIDSVIKHLEQSPSNRSKPRNKYDREIIPGVYVDVYDVLNAFTTGGPEVDHGVKKLLVPGERGDKDEITDLEEAIKSIQSRINHIKEWGNK